VAIAAPEIPIFGKNASPKIKIGSLSLYGKITKEGIERIKRLLPDTDIKINGSREVIKLH
jgi:hypothetical protein